MTVKTFFLGLIASFALPWLVVVAVPFAKMRAIEPVEYTEDNDGKTGQYNPGKNGRLQNGSLIYGAEGCAQCHSQLVRPTYAGNDLGKEDLAGIAKDEARGDTRRESINQDYNGEDYAWLGETRMGPDLSNFGRRMEQLAATKNKALAKSKGIEVDKLALEDKFDAEKWVYVHLFNPRLKPNAKKSICPSNLHMFDVKENFGQGSPDALPVAKGSNTNEQVIPNEKARTLASYLLNLKRDGDVPYSINFSRTKKKASAK